MPTQVDHDSTAPSWLNLDEQAAPVGNADCHKPGMCMVIKNTGVKIAAKKRKNRQPCQPTARWGIALQCIEFDSSNFYNLQPRSGPRYKTKLDPSTSLVLASKGC